jgi:hypothetical protein
MNEFNDNEQETKTVIPDAGIIKCEDGSFSVIKFVLEQDDSGEDVLAAYTTEISADDLKGIDAVETLDIYSILFVKISYEFQFDEESGMMEMQLSNLVQLSDATTDIPVTAQEVIETAPEDLIPVYLDVLHSL